MHALTFSRFGGPEVLEWTAARSATRARRGRGARACDLSVSIAARYALRDGAQAHALLEGRGSVGKVLLMP